MSHGSSPRHFPSSATTCSGASMLRRDVLPLTFFADGSPHFPFDKQLCSGSVCHEAIFLFSPPPPNIEGKGKMLLFNRSRTSSVFSSFSLFIHAEKPLNYMDILSSGPSLATDYWWLSPSTFSPSNPLLAL